MAARHLESRAVHPRLVAAHPPGWLLRLLLIAAFGASPCACRHNERPTATGAWVVPTGFRAYHLDASLASGLATLFGRGKRDLTVLDLGAGKGLYARYLGTLGLRNVTGYEGVRNIEELTSGRIRQREFTVAFDPCVRFDVVYCLEVAEHIPPAKEETFLRNVNCSAADGLILSWAPPGQSGTGHVNLRGRRDVLSRVSALGFAVDDAATRFISEHATLHWFKKNLLALHRVGQPSPFSTEAPAALEPPRGEVAAAAAAAVGGAAPGGAAAAEPAAPTAKDVKNALASIRAGYAKLEARVDELHLRNDVLLHNALAEQRSALNRLAWAA